MLQFFHLSLSLYYSPYCQASQCTHAHWLREALRDPRQKLTLERINHQAVARRFETWHRELKGEWVALESAILFTSGFHKMCDVTLVVEANDDDRRRRVLLRDRERSIAELLSIEALQAEEARRQRIESDYIIENKSTTSITRALEALWVELGQVK